MTTLHTLSLLVKRSSGIGFESMAYPILKRNWLVEDQLTRPYGWDLSSTLRSPMKSIKLTMTDHDYQLGRFHCNADQFETNIHHEC